MLNIYCYYRLCKDMCIFGIHPLLSQKGRVVKNMDNALQIFGIYSITNQAVLLAIYNCQYHCMHKTITI